MSSLTSSYAGALILASMAALGAAYLGDKAGSSVKMPDVKVPELPAALTPSSTPAAIEDKPTETSTPAAIEDKPTAAIADKHPLSEAEARAKLAPYVGAEGIDYMFKFVKTPVSQWKTIAPTSIRLAFGVAKTLTHPDKCPAALMKICTLIFNKYSQMKKAVINDPHDDLGDQWSEFADLVDELPEAPAPAAPTPEPPAPAPTPEPPAPPPPPPRVVAPPAPLPEAPALPAPLPEPPALPAPPAEPSQEELDARMKKAEEELKAMEAAQKAEAEAAKKKADEEAAAAKKAAEEEAAALEAKKAAEDAAAAALAAEAAAAAAKSEAEKKAAEEAAKKAEEESIAKRKAEEEAAAAAKKAAEEEAAKKKAEEEAAAAAQNDKRRNELIADVMTCLRQVDDTFDMNARANILEECQIKFWKGHTAEKIVFDENSKSLIGRLLSPYLWSSITNKPYEGPDLARFVNRITTPQPDEEIERYIRKLYSGWHKSNPPSPPGSIRAPTVKPGAPVATGDTTLTESSGADSRPTPSTIGSFGSRSGESMMTSSTTSTARKRLWGNTRPTRPKPNPEAPLEFSNEAVKYTLHLRNNEKKPETEIRKIQADMVKDYERAIRAAASRGSISSSQVDRYISDTKSAVIGAGRRTTLRRRRY